MKALLIVVISMLGAFLTFLAYDYNFTVAYLGGAITASAGILISDIKFKGEKRNG